MSLISNNMFINKLNDIVNKYNNTYSTIKMKPVDLKSSTYTDFDKKILKKALNLKLVRMLGYVLNWSEEGFVIKKLKKTVPWACVFSDINSE